MSDVATPTVTEVATPTVSEVPTPTVATVTTPTVPDLPTVPTVKSVINDTPLVLPASDETTSQIVESFIPNKLYEFLKWLALIVLYAVATFIGAVGPAWGWPHVNEIVLTLTAAGTLLGAVLGVAKATAK